MRYLIGVLCAGVFAPFASAFPVTTIPVPSALPQPTEGQAIVGVWEGVLAFYDGIPLPPPPVATTVTFTDKGEVIFATGVAQPTRVLASGVYVVENGTIRVDQPMFSGRPQDLSLIRELGDKVLVTSDTDGRIVTRFRRLK